MSAQSTARMFSLRLSVICLCLALPLLGGCGKPRNVVQLLADPDGHVGVVTVANQGGSATLHVAGCAVRVANAKTAPTPPEDLTEAEAESLFGIARRALPEKPVHFSLYFESESVKLVPESQRLLTEVLAAAKQRNSRDIAVIGHSDRAGAADYNMELSRRRATFVRNQLVKVGIAQEFLEVTSHGSSNPLVETKNPHEPKNRRVEVTVR